MGNNAGKRSMGKAKGTVRKVNADGSINVAFDDGVYQRKLPMHWATKISKKNPPVTGENPKKEASRKQADEDARKAAETSLRQTVKNGRSHVTNVTSQGIFSRCWRKIKSRKWYVGAALGVALAIPCLFGMGYELPSLGFFQSSKDDSSESSGLTKCQWAGIAAAASTLAYGGYSMLCSSKSTESSRGIFSSVLGPSGSKTSFWQKHGLMIGMLIIGLVGLGLVLWMKSTLQDESDSSESPQWPLGRP